MRLSYTEEAELPKGKYDHYKIRGHQMADRLPLDLAAVRRLTAEGKCVAEVAGILGSTRKVVWSLMVEAGIPRNPKFVFQRGELNPSYHHGYYLDKNGYVMVNCPKHPHANNAGFVREHRLVMEEKLGRHLLPSEVVHHIDGNHANNRLSNLVLFGKNSDHLRHELTGRIPQWSEDGKRRIKEGSKKNIGRRASQETRRRMSIAQASRQRHPA